jgi:sugar phosphate isomerase/epimerase
MQDSLHKYMRVGLIHFMAYPATGKGEGPIVETLRRILLDDYFDAVAISWIKDAAAKAEVKRMLRSAHVTVAYGAHPRLLTQGLNVNDPDEAGREKALATLKEGIDEAYDLGASSFVYLSGRYDPARQEEAVDRLIRSTRELCAYAKARGSLTIVLEQFDHKIDKKSLIGPAPLARHIAETITREFDNFGLLVDLSHIPLIPETPEQAIVPLRDWLATVDIGNCVVADPSFAAYGDVHPHFGYPNSVNDVDQLVEFLRVLKRVGFLDPVRRPVVSFEVKPQGDEDPEIVIANSKRTLNAAWAKLE